MSAVPCRYCGGLRKVEQVSTPEGWSNPPCSHCGAPGWGQPYDADPADQPEPTVPELYRAYPNGDGCDVFWGSHGCDRLAVHNEDEQPVHHCGGDGDPADLDDDEGPCSEIRKGPDGWEMRWTTLSPAGWTAWGPAYLEPFTQSGLAPL